MNLAAAVTTAQPNHTAPYDLAVGFYGGQFTKTHTGNILLSRLDLGHTAAVRYCLPLRTAGIQHDLTAAITAAQPDSVAAFSLYRGGGYGQLADTAAHFNPRPGLFLLSW